MSVQSNTLISATESLVSSALPAYSRFKMALKSKVQRQYPNLLEKFLDFCKFEGLDVQQKANSFLLFAKTRSQEEIEDLIIGFILIQKERIDRGEITSALSEIMSKQPKLCQSN